MGRLQSPGRGGAGNPGLQCLLVLGFCWAGAAGPARGSRRPTVRTAAAQPHPWRSGANSPSLPPPPCPSSGAQRPLARGWCGVGSGEVVFSGALLLLLLVGVEAALTGSSYEPNSTEDAARRGPGCAVLQLSPRRRPCAPPPPTAYPRTRCPLRARPPSVPTLPGLGVSRLRARSLRCASPSAPATLSSTGLCQRGDPSSLSLGWWAGSTASHHPSHHALDPLLGGSLPFVFVIGKMPRACHPDGEGGVLWGSVHKSCPLFF